jgi:hypothetical protein
VFTHLVGMVVVSWCVCMCVCVCVCVCVCCGGGGGGGGGAVMAHIRVGWSGSGVRVFVCVGEVGWGGWGGYLVLRLFQNHEHLANPTSTNVIDRYLDECL